MINDIIHNVAVVASLLANWLKVMVTGSFSFVEESAVFSSCFIDTIHPAWAFTLTFLFSSLFLSFSSSSSSPPPSSSVSSSSSPLPPPPPPPPPPQLPSSSSSSWNFRLLYYNNVMSLHVMVTVHSYSKSCK